MSIRFGQFEVRILPRESMSWEWFLKNTPPRSIALDGFVRGGPNDDLATLHFNFDHHSGVVRTATMSTAMQVLFAIKGGLMDILVAKGETVYIYINDTDQDTALAVWLLVNYKKFEGTQSIPVISRLLSITNRLDITGGAFPMNLDDSLMRSFAWIFGPYNDLRKSGTLATAGEQVLSDNIEAIMSRLDRYMMGVGEEVDLDTRHEIFFRSPHFLIVDEKGGSEARVFLFSKLGMSAFISIVARRPDGRMVCTIGKRRYDRFPIPKLYGDFNDAEGLTPEEGWNGSDTIGGSSRLLGTGLSWEQLRDITLERLRREKIISS